MSKLILNPPKIFKPLFTESARYYFLKGGRGSGKSFAVADYILFKMVQNQNLNFVGIREIQKSIKFSSKKLLEDRIAHHKLNNYFLVQDQVIKCKQGSGIMIFNGMQSHTADTITSLEGFDLVWVEEASNISTYSLEKLTPTIRKDGAELIFSYNPMTKDDPVYILEQNVSNKVSVHANYLDNPYCTTSLKEEAEEMKVRRLKKYNHIYLGQYGISEGLIFENVAVRTILENEIDGLECLCGLDFGFTDPSSFCVCYINLDTKKLYVFDGFYKVGMLNSEIAKKIIDMQYHTAQIRADGAEPKSIQVLRASNIKRVMAAMKGKDSVNMGISYLQDFDIIINAHLTDFQTDIASYAWDIDKHTGKPTSKPNHNYSHFPDSLRYAVSHLSLKQKVRTTHINLL